MPAKIWTNKQYLKAYKMGFEDGETNARLEFLGRRKDEPPGVRAGRLDTRPIIRKPKRKLSAWNKFVKANSKKPRFRYRNGKLNLKKMAVSFRRQKKR